MAASLSYSPWGEEELATESLPGYGDRFERPHYGYNAELTSPEGGLQYLRARWYDPSMGASAAATRSSATRPTRPPSTATPTRRATRWRAATRRGTSRG